MIKGLDLFRNHFAGMEEQYILIGGAACDLQMSLTPFPFRATHDLDIVLCVEGLTADFGRRFWDFIRLGGYQIQEKSNGSKKFYRFKAPVSNLYPDMIELFARKPDVFGKVELQGLTPIPLPDDVSSLSAILLDDDYYSLMLANKTTQNGISLLTPPALIVLKAKAWMDLSARREKGEHIDAKDVKKHRNDILRLATMLSPDTHLLLPDAIYSDMTDFLRRLTITRNDLENLNIRRKPDEILLLLNGLLK
jgi:predicted nucleotidyltransferase